MITWNGKEVTLDSKKIVFPFEIVSVVEFDKIIVVHIGPATDADYDRFKNEFGTSSGKGPVYAYSIDGALLWQWRTRHVNSISKVEHRTSLLLPESILKKNKFDLLIECEGWNFFIDPLTGEKISEAQVK
jgi:hypothetical protein